MGSAGNVRSPSTVNIAIAVSASSFIAVLGVAAYWDRSIRILHLFEALPYALAIVLCSRDRKSGYALAVAAGAFWLWTAATLTTFVRNGFERLAILVSTGHLDRPDILIAVPAALATAGLVLFGLWGYARLQKKWTDIAVFGLALLMIAAWFIGIFALFAPRYLGMFKKLV